MSNTMINPNKRYPSLRTIMSFGMVAVGVIASGLVSFLIYNSYSNQVRGDLRQRLANISDIIALQLDAKELGAINGESDMQNESYIRYQDFIFNVMRKESDIVYIYTVRKAEDGNFYFYLDAGSDPSIEEYNVGIPGDVQYDKPSALLRAVFANPQGTVTEEDIYADEYGSFLSAYTPIFNNDGTLNSILGVDIKADAVMTQERSVLIQTLLYFLISLPIIAFIGLLLGNRFSLPTIALTQAANEIAGGNINPIESLPSPSRETHQLMLAFNAMTRQLRELIENLEGNVQRRTLQLEKRAGQLDAISSVARSTTSLQNVEELLPIITKLVSERFGYYHTGIFLIDQNHEFAVLMAANSAGGQHMLERHHQLKLDMKSIVGYVTSIGEARIALDVGTDAVYFDNPDLPDTHSEMALPLRVGGRVIGALDVQSTKPGAFTEEDISTLTILADQISIAIENARLFSELREALKESEETFGRYIKQEWSSFAQQVKNTGYVFDGKRTTPIGEAGKHEKARSLPQTGRLSLERPKGDLAIPIRLRGQTIGVLDVKPKSGNRRWTQNDLTLLEAAVERTALALENARLVESSQKRASREQTIGEISTRIGAVSELDTIMQTAVEELGRKIGGVAEVTLELGSEE